MPQIRWSKAFFRKERETAYSDWRLAVWRELFQNSVDQKASRIDIQLTDEPGITRLIFADNGHGMPRDVLENVYFSIGDSTKDNDPTMIGGMGRARLLTCFAMQAYRIYSCDYEVVGQGQHYDVLDHAWTKGCKLDIEIDGVLADEMRRKLNEFLSQSRIEAAVFINGERVTQYTHSGRHVRNLELSSEVFAKVWVNHSAASEVIVRVNGVSMFTLASSVNARVTIALEPALARAVLTANRDGLHYRYQRVLNRFLDEITVDTSSALKSRFRRRTTVVRQAGLKKVLGKRTNPLAEARENILDVFGLRGAALSSDSMSPRLDQPHAEDSRTDLDLVLPGHDFSNWLRATFGDIYIFDETDNAAMHKVIPAYLPNNWTRVFINDHWSRRGGHIIRVLLMWQTAIQYALEVALDVLHLDDVSYGVGFTFSDDAKADHRELDGGHVFSLRPVNTAGKLDFSVTKRLDLKRIMVFAQHEVTHLAHSWHNEAFSSSRENIAIAFDEGECLRRMKRALAAARI